MDIDTIKTAAIWILIAIAVVGILLAIVIRKIIGKILVLVLAAVLVFFCWQQRDKVAEAGSHLKGSACSSSDEDGLPSFFGIDVSIPDGWCTE